jgi:hypothetical protein
MAKSKAKTLFQEILSQMEGESDRGCVLVTHAFLDERLKVLLKTHLRRVSGADGDKYLTDLIENGVVAEGPHTPLGSFLFSARMAAALGLIHPALLNTLLALNKERNKFAHRRPPNLDAACVKRVFGGFESVRETSVDLDPIMAGNFPKQSEARWTFMLLSSILIAELEVDIRAEMRRSKRRKLVPVRGRFVRGIHRNQ